MKVQPHRHDNVNAVRSWAVSWAHMVSGHCVGYICFPGEIRVACYGVDLCIEGLQNVLILHC